MPTIKQFEDLEIWQKARIIYQKVVALTKKDHLKKTIVFVVRLKQQDQ